MKQLAIETITKPMKLRGISKGIAELDGQRLEIDLDNLMIDFGVESFELDRIAGTKGGNRYFFLCPNCGNRCRKLYKRLLLYGCGSCQKIHKTTLNRSKTDCQYYWELALREARKVEPGWSPKRGGYMFDSFPERPKYMKRNKYYKHYQKFVNYTRKGDSFWLNGLSNLK
jgi:phage protein